MNADDCKEDCPKDLTAICGYNEKCYELFDDKCKMEVKNCKENESEFKVFVATHIHTYTHTPVTVLDCGN